MKIEADISLENPLDKIDLGPIYWKLSNNKKYELIHFQTKNFILLGIRYSNLKIRIHEDGRNYIKTDIKIPEEANSGNLLMYMLDVLDEFLMDMDIYQKFQFKKELNFSFHGPAGQGLFWKNYKEIKKISRKILNSEIIRLYVSDDNSLHVKLTT